MAPELEQYMQAFYSLDSCRPDSFSGIRPIPWTAIEAYGVRNGFRDIADFTAIIMAVDAAYMKLALEIAKQKEAEREAAKPASGNSGELALGRAKDSGSFSDTNEARKAG